MVQDVPNLRAHVESRAQRPLWVLVAIIAGRLVCILGTGLASRLHPPEQRRRDAGAAGVRAVGGLFPLPNEGSGWSALRWQAR
jgi:hypothetical protein